MSVDRQERRAHRRRPANGSLDGFRNIEIFQVKEHLLAFRNKVTNGRHTLGKLELDTDLEEGNQAFQLLHQRRHLF